MNAWQQILHRMESEVSRDSYENWLAPVRFSHIDSASALHLIAPNPSARRWIEQEYREHILSTARALAMALESIEFDTERVKRLDAPLPAAAAQQQRLDFSVQDSLFNPNYSFDTFVVGSCNEFAHAAATAVTANPARSYNPLYIYGGVGMGKTHLMHAIGRGLRANFPKLRVVYVSSEQFMNEMISSLRYNCINSFHERFRTADALLVDDIQSLQGKDGTQEEFFHTFNALHNTQKQIVISSDRPPKMVPGLVDRLRSRFEWGLMVDIQPPDLETKMAILDRKADQSGVNLPEAVRNYLATQMKSNFRELEGALIRLTALSSLTGAEITMLMARKALQSMGTSSKKVTIPAIQRAVAEELEIKPEQLCTRSNAKAIALPRQIAMYLCKNLTRASLPEIGRSFGGKHHTTVLHSVNKIERLRQHDQDLNRIIHSLTDRFS